MSMLGVTQATHKGKSGWDAGMLVFIFSTPFKFCRLRKEPVGAVQALSVRFLDTAQLLGKYIRKVGDQSGPSTGIFTLVHSVHTAFACGQ